MSEPLKKLNIMDLGFLAMETRETPMHVGGVNLYTLPEGVDEQEFLRDLADNLRNVDEFMSPFGDRLKTGPLGLAGSVYWEPDPAMDVDFHIRHSALPKPGRYRELFTLVSRLHATLLDRSRPLWEMHLIEGLQNRQFATYTKTHHAAVDGARSVHISRSMLSNSPDTRMLDSPLSAASWERYRAFLAREHPREFREEQARNVADALKARFDSGANILGAVRRYGQAWMGQGGALALPFLDIPRTSINTPVEGARRFVAQSWPFARIRAVGKAFGGTFNDAVMAMCGGALRQYLLTHSELPEKSLKSMVPMSLREEGDIESSNAVGAITVDLGTDIADAGKRFAAIQASARAGKAFFKGMSGTEAQIFSTLLAAPGTLIGPLGLASRMPAFNTIISNVPGMQQPMYWNGARMDGSYPASIVTDGVALNITLVTYDKNVDFGLMACRRSLPQAQRLIDYMEQSLCDLEEAAGLSGSSAQPRKKAAARKKAAPRKKAAASRKPAVPKKAAAAAKKSS